MAENTQQTDEISLHEAVEGDGQYLTFTVSGERYGVNVVGIHEIVELSPMTDLPLAPDFIRGVVNLRGKVLPVVDLTVRLGLPQSDYTKRSCIIVVDVSDGKYKKVGLLVDEVDEILEINPGHVQPPPDLGNEDTVGLITGLGQVGDNFIVLLQLKCLLPEMDEVSLNHLVEQLTDEG